MAQKRMFSLSVTDTDQFLEMPITSRLLYYELGMRADDDGFIDDWKKILKFTGLAEDDMKILMAKDFVIPFESGIIVIKHWRLNNYIRNDRHHPTTHQKELSQLYVDNDIYELESTGNTEMLPGGCQVAYRDKNRLDKNRLDKNSIYTPSEVKASSGDVAKASKHKYGKYKHVLLKDQELQTLKEDFSNWEELIDFLDEYIEMKGYKAKSHYLCIRKWVVDAVKQDHIRKGKYEATPTWKAESDNSWEEFKRNVGGDTNDAG